MCGGDLNSHWGSWRYVDSFKRYCSLMLSWVSSLPCNFKLQRLLYLQSLRTILVDASLALSMTKEDQNVSFLTLTLTASIRKKMKASSLHHTKGAWYEASWISDCFPNTLHAVQMKQCRASSKIPFMFAWGLLQENKSGMLQISEQGLEQIKKQYY